MFDQTGGNAGGKSRKINLRSLLRFSMPLSVLLYCASFNFAYVKWVSPTWSYLGDTYKSPDPFLLILGYVLAAVVCALSPLKIRRPSQVIYWLMYFTIYISGLFVPLFLQLDNGFTLLLIQLSLTGAMLLIAFSYRIPLINLRRYPLKEKLFWRIFSILFVTCNVALFIVYRHNLRFASFVDVYTVRFQARQILNGDRIIGYVTQFLANVMNPLLIAYGISVRRRRFAVLGIAGQIFVYTTAAMKSVLSSPLLVIVFYYSIKKDRGGWAPKLGLLLAGLCFFVTTAVIGAQQGILFDLASLTLSRTIAAPGVFIGEYNHFFENFSHTHLGHVNGINLLVPYQHTLSMGVEMSTFYGFNKYSSNGPIEENANFFAADGIAGFGLPGILFMGMLCAALLWVLDSCARKYPLAFSISALTMVIISLTNTSLFTTFLSNGLMVWMLLFIFMPRYFLGTDTSA